MLKKQHQVDFYGAEARFIERNADGYAKDRSRAKHTIAVNNDSLQTLRSGGGNVDQGCCTQQAFVDWENIDCIQVGEGTSCCDESTGEWQANREYAEGEVVWYENETNCFRFKQQVNCEQTGTRPCCEGAEEYSSSIVYNKGDLVLHNENGECRCYMALQDGLTGVTPSDGDVD